MFAIYSPNGRVFSGTLEELLRENPLANTSLLYRKEEINNSLNDNRENELVPHSPPSYINKKAISHYHLFLEKNDQPEPVVHIYQIMSKDVIDLSHHTTIGQAIEKFKHYKYNSFPIVNTLQQPIGLLHRQRLSNFIIAQGMSDKIYNLSLNQVFLNSETKLFAAYPVTDIRRAALIMVDNDLQEIPIVNDSDQLIGLITRGDILRCVCSDPPLSLWC